MGYTVYMHVCRQNGKRYIGITKQRPSARFGKDGYGYKTCSHFYNAIRKYGWENFDHVILYSNITKDEAKRLEKELIAKYRTNEEEYGYNIKPGGENETLPQFVKDKISASHVGLPGTNTGKHFTQEHKDKISEAQKGRKMSPSHYQNFINAMSKRRGKPGRRLQEHEVMRLAKQTRKAVKCEETGEIFESQQAACDKIGEYPANFSRAIKNHTPIKGYHFIRINTECVTTIESESK